MNAVEFEQMRGRRRTALELIDVHDLEPVVRARVASGAKNAAHRRPQCEPADAAHAVDADFHGAFRSGR